MNRAERRKHKWRKVKKLYNILRHDKAWDDFNLKLFSKKFGDNFPACNCSMCRNPRRDKLIKKWHRLTIQEKRFFVDKNKYYNMKNMIEK